MKGCKHKSQTVIKITMSVTGIFRVSLASHELISWQVLLTVFPYHFSIQSRNHAKYNTQNYTIANVEQKKK